MRFFHFFQRCIVGLWVLSWALLILPPPVHAQSTSCNLNAVQDPNDGSAFILSMRHPREVRDSVINMQCQGGCGSNFLRDSFPAEITSSSFQMITASQQRCPGQGGSAYCINPGETGNWIYLGGLDVNEIAQTANARIFQECALDAAVTATMAVSGPGIVVALAAGGLVTSALKGEEAACINRVMENPPSYQLQVTSPTEGTMCTKSISLSFRGATAAAKGEESDIPAATVDPTDGKEAVPLDKFNFCQQVPGSQRDACVACVGGDDPGESQKLYTAVGCINVNEKGLAENLIRLMLGLGGGVALLSILAAAFYLTTSQGDSGKVKEAKDLITAAVTGLFFIVFSIFILQFVGVTILRIPGLGGN